MKKIWDKLFFFNSAVCFLWVGYFSSMRSNSAVCFLWGRLFLRQWDNVKKKKVLRNQLEELENIFLSIKYLRESCLILTTKY